MAAPDVALPVKLLGAGHSAHALATVSGRCYANVMSIKRITISVPQDVANNIKKAAGKTPVSAWVADVVTEHLNDAELERQWQRFYDEVRPARQDLAKAEAVLKRLTKRAPRRGAA